MSSNVNRYVRLSYDKKTDLKIQKPASALSNEKQFSDHTVKFQHNTLTPTVSNSFRAFLESIM